MRAVVQRVLECSVTVEGRTLGGIGAGLLVYLGVGRTDTQGDAAAMVDKVVNLRIFPDEEGKMNRSVKEIGGSVLVVSQFTLFGDARRGRRPSYSEAAEGEAARTLYEEVVRGIGEAGVHTTKGEFAAHMRVASVNDGPVTILLDTEKTF